MIEVSPSTPSTPCPDCADTGFIEKGRSMETSLFCECDAGEVAFFYACDGLAAAEEEFECREYDHLYEA